MSDIGVSNPELDIDPRQWFNDPGKYVEGRIYEWEGNHFLFGRAIDQTLTAGHLCEFSTTAKRLTNDRAGGTSIGRNGPVGFAMAAAPAGRYTFFQISGMLLTSGLTDGGVAAAAYTIPHATTDGGLDTMTGTNDEQSTCGMALAADASTVMTAGNFVIKGLI